MDKIRVEMVAVAAAVDQETLQDLEVVLVKIILTEVKRVVEEQVLRILPKLRELVVDGYMRGMDMDILNIQDILQPK